MSLFSKSLAALALCGFLASPALACDKCPKKSAKAKTECGKKCDDCKDAKHCKKKSKDTVKPAAKAEKPAEKSAPCAEPKAGEEGACKM